MLEQHIESNTANKYLKTIRGVVTDAVARGWTTHNPLCTYKCSYIEPERDILQNKMAHSALFARFVRLPGNKVSFHPRTNLFYCKQYQQPLYRFRGTFCYRFG